MMIRNATNSTWGPVPWALRWAYNGILLPSLTYGCVVWSRVCEKLTVRNKLTKLNRLMALTMAPMRKGTPTAGLQVLLHLPPIDLRVTELALKAMVRVLPHKRTRWSGKGASTSGHILWGKSRLELLDIDPDDNDSLKWHLNLQRSYNVDLDSLKSGLPISDSTTKCFTDGSKLNSKVGFGLGVTRHDMLIASKNGQLGDDNSVFQAEVKAIQEACVTIGEKETDKVTIFSDSQSAILALSKILVRSEVVIDCIKSLNHLSEKTEVELKWVKAHANHTGNEFADSEARSGTTNVGNKVKVKKPLSHIKRIISEDMYNAWNQRWRSGTDCRQTKFWFPEVNRKNATNLIKLSRKDLSLMVQMITGHNRLNRHESVVNHEGDPTCRLCLEDEETSWHIISECPALWRNREQIFGQKFLDLNPEWNVNQLQKFAIAAKLEKLNQRGVLNLP